MILETLTFIAAVAAATTPFWTGYVTSYGAQKGKNKADSEDIERLTDLVESIKREHAAEIEKIKAHLQLRGALLEKRLAAHQHVFTLLKRAMVSAIDSDRSTRIRTELEAWMDDNCLWLDEQTREAVWEASRTIYPYGEAVRNKLSAEEQSKIFQPLLRAQSLVMASVDLPSVSTAELDPLLNVPVSLAKRIREQQAAASASPAA